MPVCVPAPSRQRTVMAYTPAGHGPQSGAANRTSGVRASAVRRCPSRAAGGGEATPSGERRTIEASLDLGVGREHHAEAAWPRQECRRDDPATEPGEIAPRRGLVEGTGLGRGEGHAVPVGGREQAGTDRGQVTRRSRNDADHRDRPWRRARAPARTGPGCRRRSDGSRRHRARRSGRSRPATRCTARHRGRSARTGTTRRDPPVRSGERRPIRGRRRRGPARSARPRAPASVGKVGPIATIARSSLATRTVSTPPTSAAGAQPSPKVVPSGRPVAPGSATIVRTPRRSWGVTSGAISAQAGWSGPAVGARRCEARGVGGTDGLAAARTPDGARRHHGLARLPRLERRRPRARARRPPRRPRSDRRGGASGGAERDRSRCSPGHLEIRAAGRPGSARQRDDPALGVDRRLAAQALELGARAPGRGRGSSSGRAAPTRRA